MPQTCTICRHPRRDEINQALLDGDSFRNIAKRTATSSTALFRHKNQHIPKTLALAKEVAEEVQAGTFFERLRGVGRVTLEILQEARVAGNHIIALQAIGRLERQIELEARLLGERERRDLPPKYPEYDNLTVEQLRAEEQILLEARDRIQRVREWPAGKLIEAWPGTVVEVEGDQAAE